jgi:antitoxin (DNA-binding transcriptional repressor) of toxin-antitoxin stability system
MYAELFDVLDQCQFLALSDREMVLFSLARIRARLSRLLKMVEAGDEAIASRHGRAGALIASAARPKQKLPMDELAAFRATMPSLRRASLELLREAREDGL